MTVLRIGYCRAPTATALLFSRYLRYATWLTLAMGGPRVVTACTHD